MKLFWGDFCRGQTPGWSNLRGDLARCGDVESAELGEEILRYMLRSLAPGTFVLLLMGQKSGIHQLSLVISPIISQGFIHPLVVCRISSINSSKS